MVRQGQRRYRALSRPWARHPSVLDGAALSAHFNLQDRLAEILVVHDRDITEFKAPQNGQLCLCNFFSALESLLGKNGMFEFGTPLVYFAPAASTDSTLGLNAIISDRKATMYKPAARR